MTKITEKDVYDVLEQCYDPELPIVSLMDLGLIYDVGVDGDNNVHIKMTLTTRGCPMHQHITADVKSKVETLLPDAKNVNVELVWDPQWTKDMITPEGKKKLGIE